MAAASPEPPERHQQPPQAKGWIDSAADWIEEPFRRLFHPIATALVSLILRFGALLHDRDRPQAAYDATSQTLYLAPRPHRPERTAYELGRDAKGLQMLSVSVGALTMMLGMLAWPSALGLAVMSVGEVLVIAALYDLDDVDCIEVGDPQAHRGR